MVAETCQIMHALRLHDEQALECMGLNICEIEIRRRIFWHMMSIDT